MAEGRLGTEESWERLFQELDILGNVEEHGFFQIGAEKIHAYREPRLMTKFDESEALPEGFRNNGLAILPISRTEWTIGPYRAYKAFDRGEGPPVNYFEPPADCLLLREENIRTEDQRLSQLFASGVFSRFLGEEVRYVNPGRFGTGGFSYLIGDTREKDLLHRIEVKGAQMEIDAALEGPSSIVLIEAKNFFPRDFLVRQLYYPFLSYRSGGTVGEKRMRTLYITYLSGVYQLWEYEFLEEGRYDSLALVKTERWRLKEERPFSMEDIRNALALPLKEAPQGVPYLQADNLDLAMDLLRRMGERGMSGEEAAEEIGYVSRQGGYYPNALCFFGLAEKGQDRKFRLSEGGRRMLRLSPADLWRDLAGRILSLEPFRTLMVGLITGREDSSRERAESILRKTYRLGGSTIGRRLQSSLVWCRRLLKEAKGE